MARKSMFDQRLHVPMTKEMKEKLEKVAAKKEMFPAALARELIRKGLEKEKV